MGQQRSERDTIARESARHRWRHAKWRADEWREPRTLRWEWGGDTKRRETSRNAPCNKEINAHVSGRSLSRTKYIHLFHCYANIYFTFMHIKLGYNYTCGEIRIEIRARYPRGVWRPKICVAASPIDSDGDIFSRDTHLPESPTHESRVYRDRTYRNYRNELVVMTLNLRSVRCVPAMLRQNGRMWRRFLFAVSRDTTRVKSTTDYDAVNRTSIYTTNHYA